MPPLTYNAKLDAAAQGHASDMAARNYFRHESGPGISFGERVTAAGYAWVQVTENIAAGQGTPEEVVRSWLDSPRHCENLMQAGLQELGVGFVVTRSGQYGTYWVQDFGTPKSK